MARNSLHNERRPLFNAELFLTPCFELFSTPPCPQLRTFLDPALRTVLDCPLIFPPAVNHPQTVTVTWAVDVQVSIADIIFIQ